MNQSEQNVTIKSGYILVHRPPSFVVRWADQAAQLEDLASVCEQAGYQKVLVVGSQTNVHLSTLELFRLGEAVASLGLQIAIVELHDASNEDAKFLENVTTNRGGPMRFFDNETDAKQWLGID